MGRMEQRGAGNDAVEKEQEERLNQIVNRFVELTMEKVRKRGWGRVNLELTIKDGVIKESTIDPEETETFDCQR